MNEHGVKSDPSALQFFEVSPPIKTYYNVIYHPQYRCLFSGDGLRIDDSCRPHKSLVDNIPNAITPPQNLNNVSQKLIYGGTIIWHYGHFLTESISRLWYALEDEVLPILYSEATRDLITGSATSNELIHRAVQPKYPINKAFDKAGVYSKSSKVADAVIEAEKGLNPASNFIDVFMDSVPFDRKRFISFEKPVRIQEIIIPHPSFTLNKECFSVHKILPESVAEKVLIKVPEETSQPLYLSRSRLTRKNSLREIENETELEEILRKKNCIIVYPEQLDLKEQIWLINKHRVIIGVCGSALHSILFDIGKNTHLVCINDFDRIDINFLLVDAIKGVNSTYFAALTREEDNNKVPWMQKRSIDVNRVLTGLQDLGLF